MGRLNACQLYLQQFQGKLADKLNVESALSALKEFQSSAGSTLAQSSAKAVENVTALRDQIQTNGMEALRANFETAYESVSELKERLMADDGILRI